NRPWEEGEATWNLTAAGEPWASAGAQGGADRGSTVLGTVTATSGGAHTVTLGSAGLAVVQSWIDDPAANYGIVIQDYTNASNGFDFRSREAGSPSDRPKLTITYVPAAGSAVLAATVSEPVAVQTDATPDSPQPQELAALTVGAVVFGAGGVSASMPATSGPGAHATGPDPRPDELVPLSRAGAPAAPPSARFSSARVPLAARPAAPAASAAASANIRDTSAPMPRDRSAGIHSSDALAPQRDAPADELTEGDVELWDAALLAFLAEWPRL
ncbi:MAG: DNRLRE domain-containing protein, partial [Pirellulales bacterium]